MSSNTRTTHSKGPSDGMSLPPYTRPRKDTNTKADNTESMTALTQQQTACDQLNSTVGHSRLQDQVHGQVQVRHLPHRQGCPRHPPVHSPSQAAVLDRHHWKLISPGQPHKLQDHQPVTCPFHPLVALCFHEM